MSSRLTKPSRDGRAVVLYDGHCAFCRRSSRRLQRLAGGTARLRRVSFQRPGALEEFPGITHSACMQAMHVVLPSGKIVRGAEAVARVLATVPWVGVLAYLYYVPLLRTLAELAYAAVARHRYSLFVRRGVCQNGACNVG